MSVRSIDLQVLIPRSTEVSRVQQVSDQQAALQQQQSAAEWQRLSATRQQQVQRSPQSAGGKIEPDARDAGKRQDADHRKEQRQQADAEEAENTDPIRGHTIDIKT